MQDIKNRSVPDPSALPMAVTGGLIAGIGVFLRRRAVGHSR
jgi:hypothetical protein